MDEEITCPLCGKADQVEKVSTIYILAIGPKPSSEAAPLMQEQPSSQDNIGLRGIPKAEMRELGRRLKPPSAGKQVTRPIHPDMVVLIFSLVAPLFLYGIMTSQPGVSLPMLAFLACAYGLYFWQRKKLVAKFEHQRAAQQAAEERAKQGVEAWMKLYYCARDDGIFEPGSSQLTPTDQMSDYLLQERSIN